MNGHNELLMREFPPMNQPDGSVRHKVRELILKRFPLPSDFEAFCVDYFPKIAQRFAGEMDYVSRLNLLLSLVPPEELIKMLGHEHDLRQEACPYFIPPPRSSFNYLRQDYQEYVDKLQKALGPIAELASLRAVCLSGAAGTGKTLVARAYADCFRADYGGQFMLDAETGLSLGQSCIKLCAVLGISLCDPSSLKEARWQCQQWLKSHPRWLLIFKNVTQSEWFVEFWRQLVELGPIGHVLIVTRQLEVGTPGVACQVLPIGVFSCEEGVKFLCLYADRPVLSKSEQLAAVELVTRLNGSPLALAHAAHYLRKTRIAIALHLNTLKQHPVETVNRKYGMEFASTMEVHLNRYQAEQPMCADFLKLCSFLHGGEIPLHLLYEGFSIKVELLQLLGPQFVSDISTPEDLHEKLILPLESDGLISCDPATAGLSMRWLLQMLVREQLSVEERSRWACKAITAIELRVLELDQKIEAEGFITDPMLRQVENCLALIQEFKINTLEAAVLLNRAGRFLHEQHLFERAATSYLSALEILEHLDRDSVTATGEAERAYCQHGLGRIAFRKGDYADAESHFQQALALRLKCFGAAHPEYATTLNNLALLRLYKGELDPSVLAQLEEALAIRREKLGSQHLLVAKSLNNIGMYWIATGNLARAESTHREALLLRETLLNPNHPDVVQSLNGLATCLAESGSDKQAETLFKRALAIQQQSQRPGDPDMAFALGGLGRLWAKRGPAGWRRARTYLEQALRIRQQAIGKQHAFTASSLYALAQLERIEGRYAEALAGMQQARRVWEQVPILPSHPRYKRCCQELALLEAQLSQAPALQSSSAEDGSHRIEARAGAAG